MTVAIVEKEAVSCAWFEKAKLREKVFVSAMLINASSPVVRVSFVPGPSTESEQLT